MKTSLKTLQDVGNLHDLRTYTGTVRKSAKPVLPTTAILDLYMRKNEKERIEKELKRLKKRRVQLMRRLKETKKDMEKLVDQATQTAMEIGGKPAAKRSSLGKKGGMVLEY